VRVSLWILRDTLNVYSLIPESLSGLG